MEYTKQQLQGQEVMRAIITKCWEDESFKNELIASPKETIERFTGNPVNVPEGVELVAVDQTNETNVYINIHAPANVDDLQLSDEQLELVAGGEFAALGISLAIVGLFGAGIAIGQAID